jgi:hypothetical protein
MSLECQVGRPRAVTSVAFPDGHPRTQVPKDFKGGGEKSWACSNAWLVAWIGQIGLEEDAFAV